MFLVYQVAHNLLSHEYVLLYVQLFTSLCIVMCCLGSERRAKKKFWKQYRVL